MPNYEDFVRDYWAPDREQVLAQFQAEQQANDQLRRDTEAGAPWGGWGTPGGQGDPYYDGIAGGGFGGGYFGPPDPQYADFERDYWAPDRDAVLAQMQGPQGGGGWWSGPAQGAGGIIQPGYGGGGAFDENALSQAWLSSGGKTPQDLARFLQEHPDLARGVTIFGSKGDKLRLPDGRTVDAVLSAGAGGLGGQWNVEGGGGGVGTGGGGSTGGRSPNPTPFNYDPFVAPDAFQFRAFEAPTGLTEENDPGFQARLALGQQAVERSAAARGTLLTGGTLKDLNQFGQNLASDEFGNVYNRALQTYGTQYGQAAADYNANYQNALNAYKTNFETKFKPWEANYNQAYNSWWGNTQAANQDFQNNLASQQQRYNQLYGAAQLGLQATGQQAQYGQGYGNSLSNIYGNYGNQGSDLITGAGNANAAGTVGAGNAWGNFAGNAGNTLGSAGLYGLYGNQGGQQYDYYGMAGGKG